MEQQGMVSSRLDDQTFVGTVMPIDWDSEGKAIHFCICTLEGEDVILMGDRYTKRLRKLIGKRALARGPSWKDEHGELIMLPRLLKRVPEDPEPHPEIDSVYPECPVVPIDRYVGGLWPAITAFGGESEDWEYQPAV